MAFIFMRDRFYRILICKRVVLANNISFLFLFCFLPEHLATMISSWATWANIPRYKIIHLTKITIHIFLPSLSSTLSSRPILCRWPGVLTESDITSPIASWNPATYSITSFKWSNLETYRNLIELLSQRNVHCLNRI